MRGRSVSLEVAAMVVKRDSYPEFAPRPGARKRFAGYGYWIARAGVLLGFAAVLALEGWLIWRALLTWAVR